MASPRVLLSGDYWHGDFKNLNANLFIPATLVPFESLQALDANRFSLIVIAQSRSNQFAQEVIDDLVARNPLTPVVMLLGSWCEGERRTDRPIEGVKHVYWHQWSGQFTKFCQQMAQDGVSLWHTPPTESDADRVVSEIVDRPPIRSLAGTVVGISASSVAVFDSLSHGVTAIGGKAKWVEHTSWINLLASIEIICIDANSLDASLKRRVRWLKSQTVHVPMIAILNFPRTQEIEELKRLGVSAILSKPFELSDFCTVILSVVGASEPKLPLRGPLFSASRRRAKKN